MLALYPLGHASLLRSEEDLSLLKGLLFWSAYCGYTEKVVKDLSGDRQNEK